MITHHAEKRHFMAQNPVRTICISFALVILAGTVLLTLPICSRDGKFTPLLDALFTATSATCVTGLIVYDTYQKFTPLGQAVILMLIQIGGLGLLTITSFFNIILGRKLGLRGAHLASESASASELPDTPRLLKTIMLVSLLCEGAGALLLMLHFVPKYGSAGVGIGVFLAVSAFCNAGFDILGREGAYVSLCNYNDDPLVLIVISSLIIMGGLGFVVWKDLAQYRRTKKLMLHTKIVLLVTAILIVAGTLGFMALEWGNPKTLGALPVPQRVLASYFQSVTARTAGYNSIDNAAMGSISKLLTVVLMFIGASPASTGGGIKTTTFTVLILTVVSVMLGRDETVIMKRKVEKQVVYKALAIMFLAGGVVLVTTFIIYFTMDVDSIDALFEATSAFGTVGLTVGISPKANTASKIAMILTMFLGRVGPVSLPLALAFRQHKRHEVIPEGKILVG